MDLNQVENRFLQKNLLLLSAKYDIDFSTGIGSETQKLLAIAVIDGLVTSTFLTLFVFPLIVKYVYGKKFAYRQS